jgi:hypothetical protein
MLRANWGVAARRATTRGPPANDRAETYRTPRDAGEQTVQLAIDLTRRQASRVLGQAECCHARLEIEPAHSRQRFTWQARLAGSTGKLLALELIRLSDDEDALLVGTYLDVRMWLDDDLYLFTTCVMDHDASSEPARVMVAVPDAIQIANRRRFERTNATIASQVRLWINADEPAHVGTLASVSANGLAVDIHGLAIDDCALLGDSTRVRFELPAFDAPFELPGMLCSKEIDREKKQVRIGLEFAQTGTPEAASELNRLRAALAEFLIDLADPQG